MYGLLFSSLEGLRMVYWIRKYNSIVKSTCTVLHQDKTWFGRGQGKPGVRWCWFDTRSCRRSRPKTRKIPHWYNRRSRRWDHRWTHHCRCKSCGGSGVENNSIFIFFNFLYKKNPLIALGQILFIFNALQAFLGRFFGVRLSHLTPKHWVFLQSIEFFSPDAWVFC